MNWIDKAITYIDPVRAHNRAIARAKSTAIQNLVGAYKSARTDRRPTKEWATSRGDADSDTLFDLTTLRERSRDAIRNNPIATGAENIHAGNIVGRGIKLQSRIDRTILGMTDDEADVWENRVETEFRLWAESKDCDLSRTMTFYDYQELAVRQMFANGDVFILTPREKISTLPYSLRLQMIEADRISNPANERNTDTLLAGIEKDSNGAPVAYHIAKQHPGSVFSATLPREWQRVDAFGENSGLRNVIHLYKILRPGQTRGVPTLAPVIEQLRQLEQFTEAELTAAVISSMFTVFVRSETGEVDFDITETSGETGATVDDKDFKLAAGAILGLAPNEDISIADPKRPNAQFDPFFIAILKQIGTALELPFEVLIKHFDASYSASRAALMEAWRFFRQRREWIARHFCQEIYNIWLYEAVALGRIAAPGFFSDPLRRWAYSHAVWIGDAPIQIDPVKEIMASKERIATGLSTVDEETAFITGGDFESNFPRIRKEVKMYQSIGITHPAILLKAGQSIQGEEKKENKEDVDE